MIIPSRGLNDRRGETRNTMNNREILRREAQLTAEEKVSYLILATVLADCADVALAAHSHCHVEKNEIEWLNG